MIFLDQYNFENVNDIEYIFYRERENINYFLQFQQDKKNILVNYMQQISNSTNNIEMRSVHLLLNSLEDLKVSLEHCNNNISLLENLLSEINNVELDIKNKKTDSIRETLKSYNLNYSSTCDTLVKTTTQIEDCIINVSSYLEKYFSACSKNNEQSELTSNTTSNMNNEEPIDYVENTLIISESSGNVILPYDLSTLNNILKDNPEEYSNINDIIVKSYTLPMSSFKTPSIARFREAFKLMRFKEKRTIKDSFDLGIELMFNYNLHPAIIAACKDLNELDIYLDYLDSGETNKFDCFKIIFNIAPTIVK